jgi:hypothetical protein
MQSDPHRPYLFPFLASAREIGESGRQCRDAVFAEHAQNMPSLARSNVLEFRLYPYPWHA